MFVKVSPLLALVQYFTQTLQALSYGQDESNEAKASLEIEFSDHSIDDLLCLNVMRRRQQHPVRMVRLLLQQGREFELACYEFTLASRVKVLELEGYLDPDFLYPNPLETASELARYVADWVLGERDVVIPDYARTFSFYNYDTNPPQD